jgi:hypothetical protein
VILSALLLSGCVAPARGSDDYRNKALGSVQAAGSEVGTVRITVQAFIDGRTTQPYADEVVSAAEDALGSVTSSFGAVQPPDPTVDQVQGQVSRLLGAASGAVTDARIALRRSDGAALRTAELRLTSVGRRLDREAGRLQ